MTRHVFTELKIMNTLSQQHSTSTILTTQRAPRRLNKDEIARIVVLGEPKVCDTAYFNGRTVLASSLPPPVTVQLSKKVLANVFDLATKTVVVAEFTETAYWRISNIAPNGWPTPVLEWARTGDGADTRYSIAEFRPLTPKELTLIASLAVANLDDAERRFYTPRDSQPHAFARATSTLPTAGQAVQALLSTEQIATIQTELAAAGKDAEAQLLQAYGVASIAQFPRDRFESALSFANTLRSEAIEHEQGYHTTNNI